MTDDTEMRIRLQQVAAYRGLCQSVRRSGRGNVFFALLMLFLAYVTWQLGPPNWVLILYVALAVGELAVGLFKSVAPSAEGVLFDGLVLLAFALFNFGIAAMRMQAGGRPSPVVIFLSLYMLFGSFSRFKVYGRLRQLFAERPTADQLAWFDGLVQEIRAADPQSDELALDLPTQPRWQVKLFGSTAFFVTARGETVVVAGSDEFLIERERKDHGTGRRRARLWIHGQLFPEFGITDASWQNYLKWTTAQPALPQ